MINAMQNYNYFTYGNSDEYGQATLSQEPQGTIKISIFLTSQSVQDNINYKSAQYQGLTHNPVDDTYVIEYGDKRLKVLYVNTSGRFTQVFMGEI